MAARDAARLNPGDEFSDLDLQFARFMERLNGGPNPGLFLAALLVSGRTAQGDICLHLPALAGTPLPPGLAGVWNGNAFPDLNAWLKRLRESRVTGSPGTRAPLVLDERGRLYLHRYWEYEQLLAGRLLSLSARRLDGLDTEGLRRRLRRLFPTAADGEIDWQQVAALTAATGRLAVVSGGPGTGKTYTVAKILALLLEEARERGADLQVALAAPTGKAAARLQEAVKAAKEGLDCDGDIKERIPVTAGTLHRLLSPVIGTPYFRHNERNPLSHDVVVVDESSMVDLALMAKLCMALKEDARLILLGDRDQLASVEAGAVMGDICGAGAEHRYSAAFARFAGACGCGKLPRAAGGALPFADSVAVLRKSYRFGAGSGIGELSRAVREGRSAEALELLEKGRYPDIRLEHFSSPASLHRVLEQRVEEGFGPCLAADTAEEAHRSFGRFIVLCALRQGPYGVERANALVERVLARSGAITAGERFYHGRPIMVTRNDYGIQLFNGDVGIIMREPDGDGALRAFFPSPEGRMRSLAPWKLPEHETAFAITVHKSQGSEFDRVLLILPDRPGPLLTRELVYTAVTRARRSVEILASPAVLRGAIDARIHRESGLREALWGEA